MFQQPSQGDRVNVGELVGSLVLIWVREFREDVTTTFGPSDAVAVDLHALDGPKGGEKFENTLIFQKALIGSLRSAVGGEPVLGRIGQGTAKLGQSAPYILNPYDDADAALATGYIQRMAKPFQPPATATPTPAAPAAAAASPSPAAASPATGNGAVTAAQFAILPLEVQELMRQNGHAPAGV